jgi:uncharacterized protein
MNTRPSQRILKKETNSIMKISNIFSFLVPKNALFFDLFAEDTANLVEQARVFNTLFTTHDKDQQLAIIRRVKELESVGDEITHKIFLEPFDREDIHALATSLDDIADYIHGSASRIELYNVKEFSKTMEMLSEVIVKQVIEIDAAVKDMKNMRNAQRVREAIIRVNSLENHADDLFDEAIGRLFAEEVPALELIKIKEVLANLETATDKCEDVANVLESILVKNS